MSGGEATREITSARVIKVEVRKIGALSGIIYKIILPACKPNAATSDLDLLKEGLCRKNKNLAGFFMSPDCSYAYIEETSDSEVYEIGCQSPILSVSKVICTLPPTPATKNHLSDSDIAGRDGNHCGVQSPLVQGYAVGNVQEPSKSNFSLSLGDSTYECNVLEPSCSSNSIQLEDSTFLGRLDNTLLASTPVRSESRGRGDDGHLPASNSSTQEGCDDGLEGCGRPPARKRRLSTTENLPPITDVKFDMKKFSMPVFNKTISMNLRNKLPLSPKSESAVCRAIRDRVEEQTLNVKIEELRPIAAMFIDANPHLIFRGDRAATLHAWSDKLGKCLSRERIKHNVPMKKGRQPKEKKLALLCPAKKKQSTGQVDKPSYEKHTKKMIDLYRKNPNDDSLESLWELTYEVRRRVATTEGQLPKNSTAHDFIQDHCPVLSQVKFLFKEFDRIVPDACKSFRLKWDEISVKIIIIAERQRKRFPKIAALFEKFPDYNHQQTLSLLLLPLLIGTNTTNRPNHPDYFAHLIADDQSLFDGLNQVKRDKPFIGICGTAFHIIVDAEPLYRIEDEPGEAFLALMACYYVFDICYEKAAEPTLWFAQSFMLNLSDDKTDTCYKVRAFVDKLKKTALPDEDSM